MKYRDKDKVLQLEIEDAVNLVVQAGLAAPRRASMLMAYGLNASKGTDTTDYHLPGFIQLVDVPRDLSSEDRERVKFDFEHWIVGNGFRELLEGMETFLNSLFALIARMDFFFKGKRPEKAQRLVRRFESYGVWKKLDHLETHYGFTTGMEHYYRSLTQARNCLTHRRGFVGEKDIDHGDALELNWLGVDVEFTEGDGTKHIVTLDTEGPIDSTKFSGGDKFQLTTTFVDRTLAFKKGERISVPPRSLQEICFMSGYTCTKLHQLVINWLLEENLFVNNGAPLPNPEVEMLLDSLLPDEMC